ncbi:Rieske (2Fe-2S) protein [Streptomyces griseoluteus]|uniref:Rieske (2Fe-2S) protein n=1 Tax=Streptomyces griseoluteus TaxID=29306 RepID=UPI0038170DA0
MPDRWERQPGADARADRCSHLAGSLSEGKVSGGCVQCHWHGSGFRREPSAPTGAGRAGAGRGSRGTPGYGDGNPWTPRLKDASPDVCTGCCGGPGGSTRRGTTVRWAAIWQPWRASPRTRPPGPPRYGSGAGRCPTGPSRGTSS